MPPKRKRLIDATGICVQQTVAYRLCVMAHTEHKILKIKLKQFHSPQNNSLESYKTALKRICEEEQIKLRETTNNIKILLQKPQIITVYPY